MYRTSLTKPWGSGNSFKSYNGALTMEWNGVQGMSALTRTQPKLKWKSWAKFLSKFFVQVQDYLYPQCEFDLKEVTNDSSGPQGEGVQWWACSSGNKLHSIGYLQNNTSWLLFFSAHSSLLFLLSWSCPLRVWMLSLVFLMTSKTSFLTYLWK